VLLSIVQFVPALLYLAFLVDHESCGGGVGPPAASPCDHDGVGAGLGKIARNLLTVIWGVIYMLGLDARHCLCYTLPVLRRA
jgi:hypothetical protein